MKWLKWTCERCGKVNQSAVPALPRAERIDAVCRGCRVKSAGAVWTEASAPERTVNAEDGGWACPFCKAHNDVAAGTVGFARLKCSVCDQTCGVVFPGGLDAPGEDAAPGDSSDRN